MEMIMLGMLGRDLSGDGPHGFTQLCQGDCLLPSPLALSGSSEGGQNEHQVGPVLQDWLRSQGALFPGQGCWAIAFIYCFLMFNFPSLLPSVIWDSYVQSGNSSVLVLYLAVSSKDDRGPFHHIAHRRQADGKGPHTVRALDSIPMNSRNFLRYVRTLCWETSENCQELERCLWTLPLPFASFNDMVENWDQKKKILIVFVSWEGLKQLIWDPAIHRI